MKTTTESKEKRRRLLDYMKRKGLKGVALTQIRNFAWYTCGRDNHVAGATEMGFATVIVTPERQCVVTSNIEAGRIAAEEVGEDFEVHAHPWHDDAQKNALIRKLLGTKRAASDDGVAGLPLLDPDFAELRWTLTPEEIKRYGEVGRAAGAVMGAVCREITPGMRESDVAGLLAGGCLREQVTPTVILIAADERVFQFRHPIVTGKKVRKHIMVVLCAARYGLVCSLTRLVHFGRLPADLRRKHEACVAVDAAFNLGSRPGRTAGEVFRDATAVYAQHGFPGEWQHHHQGGLAGYKEREYVANAADRHEIVLNQSFAWNPSIQGTKSEDTIIVTAAGPEVITSSPGWPMLDAAFGDRVLPRPAILEK